MRLETADDDDAALAAVLPVTLDVVVPSYRVNIGMLRILSIDAQSVVVHNAKLPVDVPALIPRLAERTTNVVG